MLRIGLLWHMHQPLYVDPATGMAVLPWVRLHACRAYWDMIRLASEYESLRTTFNLVPVLIAQLEQLAAGQTDVYRELARKPAADLDEHERDFLLEKFFQANWATLVQPNSGYRRLLDLRGGTWVSPQGSQRFGSQDLRDLQVWFNLAWFGFTARREYPELQELMRRQHGFSEDDKRRVLAIQDEIPARVLAEIRRASESGQIEISTTPFYHPILPLLCDTDSAARALPEASLPQPPFRHPEDALAQIERSLEFCQERFGCRPMGLWPSEGSVSPELVPLLRRADLRWFATNEGILERSKIDPGGAPVLCDGEGRRSVLEPCDVGGLALFFRHHALSDRIGFTYAHQDGAAAAADFLARARALESATAARHPFLPIILDGENPWEHYPDSGEKFLRSLYHALTTEADLRSSTFSAYLERLVPATRIQRLWSGSWIASDFAIWIGHAEDVAGWNLLRETRTFLEQQRHLLPLPSEKALEAAWESLFAAEGSDWFWWFGDEFSSSADEEFDYIFRAHLKRVYELLGFKPPQKLQFPIKGTQAAQRLPAPTGYIRAVVDGRLSHAWEWEEAGRVPLSATGGAMARGRQLLAQLHYGFDAHTLYLRIDPGVALYEQVLPEAHLSLMIVAPRRLLFQVPLTVDAHAWLEAADPTPGARSTSSLNPAAAYCSPDRAGSSPESSSSAVPRVASNRTGPERLPPAQRLPDAAGVRTCARAFVELALPRTLLHLEGDGVLEFILTLETRDGSWVRYPGRAVFRLELPGPEPQASAKLI